MRPALLACLLFLLLLNGCAQEKKDLAPAVVTPTPQTATETPVPAPEELPTQPAEEVPEMEPAKDAFEAELRYNTSIPSFSKAKVRGIIDKSAPAVVKQTLFVEGLPRLSGRNVFATSHKDGVDFDYYSAWLVDESGKHAPTHVDDFNPFSSGETKEETLFNRSDLPPGSLFEKDYKKIILTVEANQKEEIPASSGVILYAAFFNHKLDPDNLQFKYNSMYPDFSAATARLAFNPAPEGLAVNGQFTGLPRLEEVDDPVIEGNPAGLDFDYYAVWLVASDGKNQPVLAGKFNAEPSGATDFSVSLKPVAFKGTDFKFYDKAYISVEVNGVVPKKPGKWVIYTGEIKPAT